MPQPLSILDSSPLYDVYRVTIAITGKLCGGVPRNPDLIGAWVKARTGHDDAKTAEQIADIEAHVEACAEKCWNGFLSDESGLFLEARCIKAMFKECATVLGITKTKLGCKQIFQHGFEIKSASDSDRIHLDRLKPDGTDENAIHVMTAQGPRTALKRVDYVENVTVTFFVWVLATHPSEKRHIGEADLARILALGQENGMGSDRSQGKGKFVVTSFSSIRKGVLAKSA